MYQAYQGRDKDLLKSLEILVRFGNPAWTKVAKATAPSADSQPLMVLAVTFQAIGAHHFALPTRQVLTARRGRYDRQDREFIASSLQALAAGPTAKATMERLAAENSRFVRLWDTSPMIATAPAPSARRYYREQLALAVTVDKLFQVITPRKIADFQRQAEPLVAELFAELEGDAKLLIEYTFEPERPTQARIEMQVTRQADDKPKLVDKLQHQLAQLKPLRLPSKWQLMSEYASGELSKRRKIGAGRATMPVDDKTIPVGKTRIGKLRELANRADMPLMYNQGNVTFPKGERATGDGPWLLLAPDRRVQGQ